MNKNEEQVSKRKEYKILDADECDRIWNKDNLAMVACAQCSKFVHVDEAVSLGDNWWLCPQCNAKADDMDWSVD